MRQTTLDQLAEIATLLKAARARADETLRELEELHRLVVAFAGEHAHNVFANDCPACKAEKRIRDIARALGGRPGR